MNHCRYCHLIGHNQRTCPQKTATLKKRHDKDIANGLADSYWVKEYQKRVSPSGKKKSQQTCGYCQERGHTRRKCEEIQKDMQWFVKHHNEHVRVAHDYLVSSPVGIGSLFRATSRNYDYNISDYVVKNTLNVVTGFTILQEFHTNGVNIYATLTDPSSGVESQIALRNWVKDPAYKGATWNKNELVSADCGILPSDWFSENCITLASAKSHELFKRVGRKQEDHQDWTFTRIESWSRAANVPSHSPNYDYQAEAQQKFAQYSAVDNRAKMFADFKSGQ